MDKIYRDKRKEVHARLDFRENSRKSRKGREGSQNSSARTLPTRYRNLLERPKMRDRLRYNDRDIFDRLGQTLGIVLTVEAILAYRILLLAKIVLEADIASETSKNYMREKKKGKQILIISRVGERHQRWKILKVKVKKTQATDEEDLAVPWSCGVVGLFTPRIRNFKSSRKTRMPNNVKTYDEKGDPEDHVKIFQAAAQVKHWAVPTWCHMFNSTLIGTARKYIKDPVEIYNIKQRDEETVEDFKERFKLKKHIEELVRAGKDIKQDRDQPKVGKKEVSAKGKSTAIYMVQSWISACPTEEKGSGLETCQCHPSRESDEEKTAFHTSHGVYCYTKMPFGLKNAGATYQRLVDKAFDSQVGRNIEIYVDDLVIKSHTETEMLRDIDETLCTLRKMNMKLNPKKCTFGAVEGMFMGYMISPEGIKPCPDKTEAVLQLPVRAFLVGRAHMILKSFPKPLPFEEPNEAPPDTPVVETPQESWTLFTDGSSCVDGSCAGLILTSPEETEFTYALRGFANFSISQVSRSKNKKADALSKITSTSFAHLSKQVLVEVLKKSIQEKEVATVVEEDGPTWMTPIMEYLKDGTLPDDRKEASKLHIKARQYELLKGVLYSRSFLKPWLRTTVRGGQSRMVRILLANHASGCTRYDTQMKGQTFDSRYGLFYIVDRGESRGDNRRQPGEEVRVGQHSVLHWLFRRNSIEQRSLSEGIKTRLGEGNKNWIEELSHVLWAHRKMIKSSHGDTPFSLTYRTEAVIPAEIEMPMYRTAVVDVVHNDEKLRLNLDLLEERREHAAINEAKAKSKMTNHVVGKGKLGPQWEGPYEVTEALRDGVYRLRSMDGMVLPRAWNIANLKKCLSLSYGMDGLALCLGPLIK
uniref:Reverse transcriptase domain-containing protein n=1 Tax=Tanacetum cinerariifolium TaxID=118510 RepID=A0A6L2NJZ0_TANCI|nr:reverse transcriptase domain-containing protein [Tanacetum cinerariifolium]